MRMSGRMPEGRYCTVYLDGEKLPDCLVADDEQGWAACQFRDADGRIVLIEDGVITEIKRGEVRFEFDPDTARLVAEEEARKAARRATREAALHGQG